MSDWLTSTPDVLLHAVITLVAIYAAVIGVTRLGGLRTFAKMSSFDLAITVAFGTVLASTIMNPKQSIVLGVVVMFTLIMLQMLFSVLKRKFDWFKNAFTNSPLLLMDGPNILYDNMRKARVDENELIAKLREANVIKMEQVRAVVLETTGDISVLHTNDPDKTLQQQLLKDVRRS